MSADVLRRAAQRPNAPPRLARAADAVLEGKFSWEDVASGQCQHPLARALYTGKAREVLGPALREAAGELAQEQQARAEQTEQASPARRVWQDDDQDFSQRTYLEYW